MTNEGRKKSMRKVKSLKVKSLSADKAKHVKGGPIIHPGSPREAAGTAVQKVRE